MSHRSFIEGKITSDCLDPLVTLPLSENFPYDEIFDRLDGATKFVDELSDDIRVEVSKAIHRLNEILMSKALESARTLDPQIRVGRLYLILNWLLNPNVFLDEKSISAAQLAKCLGISPATISTTAAELSRELSVHNRYQFHNWRRHLNIAPRFEPPAAEHEQGGEDENTC